MGEGSIAVTDPASGETLASIASADAGEVRAAIAAAEVAMVEWKAASLPTVREYCAAGSI